MDDCTLKSLVVKPGKLLPSFKKGITEYNLTVGSQVDSVTFDCETSDKGASYSISGSGGGKSVKVNEGQLNNIKIEVTAEDGTTKAYWIHAKRLSAKDAALAGIEIKGAVLNPPFASNVFEYFGLLPCNISSISVIPVLDDPKASIKVNGGKPGSTVPLNVGQTVITVEVTSPDGSSVQLYTIFLIRKQIPLFVRFTDTGLSFKYECPVSLAPLYQPVTVKGSQPVHTYSGPIIDSFTRTSKVDPIGEQTLDPDWRLPNYELDKEMSEALVSVPLISGGLSEKVKFTDLGSRLKDFDLTPKLQAEKSKFEKNSAPLKHTVEVRTWEKQLQQIFDVTDAVKLELLSNDAVEKYFTSLPDVGQALPTYGEGQSPVDYLDRSLICLASAIEAGKTKNPGLHLRLGMILEEKFHLEDVIGVKKEKSTVAAGMDMAAQESSKAEECDAICRLRGLPPNASAAAQLKAIDEEYHSLLEKNQSFKADHVQALYAWKSTQAAKDGGGGSGGIGSTQKTVGENSLVNQAYLKYLDALSLDDTKAVHHFHVGRMLVVLGEYDKAVPRLEAALGWNDQHELARFYLGVALVLKKGGPGNRSKDSLAYLLKGLQLLLRSGIEEALKTETTREKKLSTENLLCFSNVCLLQGLLHLGQLVSSANSSSGECLSAVNIWQNVALLASIAMTTVARGDTYRKLEQVLMDAHSLLLQKLLETSKENVTLIGARCERLSAIIRHSTIPPNAQLLQLQLKTSQTLARIQPCSSYALYLLGNAQLASYDFEPNSSGAKDLLSDSRKSFLASILMEGSSSSGEPLPQVTDQKWWQEKVTQNKTNVEQSSGPGKVPASSTPGKLPLSAPGKVPAAGGRGGAKVSTPGNISSKTSATSLTGPALKGKAAVTRGGGAGRGVGRGGASGSGKTSVVLGKGPTKTAAPNSSNASATPAFTVSAATPKATSEPEAKPVAESTIVDQSSTTVMNQASFHPRLGLARALSRGAKDLSEAKKYYLEAISMAPQEHSAYIEVAELLTETDPLGAVDIYCKFPIPPNPTFNDAYIFGEIVRLLFKAEKYDDSRLLSNMIALGKIMGLASLEKYVETLQKKFKTEFLKHLYAGVNEKQVDDPMMQQFFKIKCWI